MTADKPNKIIIGTRDWGAFLYFPVIEIDRELPSGGWQLKVSCIKAKTKT